MYICLQANMVLIFHLVSVWTRVKVISSVLFLDIAAFTNLLTEIIELFECFIENHLLTLLLIVLLFKIEKSRKSPI